MQKTEGNYRLVPIYNSLICLMENIYYV